MMSKTVLQPADWATPKGYANGVAARGRLVFVAGQIGWNAQCEFESDDLVDQVRQALLNVRTVLAQGGAGPEHITRMTWYLMDRRAYVARAAEIGRAYREVLGREFAIAMSAVQVARLVEDRAQVEIEVTAAVPD